jgi:hypothetical protein
VISPTKEIAVTSDNDDELAGLTREIDDKATYVHNQAVLIEVLKRDGHDVSDHESDLAARIARLFRLLEIASASEGYETAASAQG